MARLRFRNFSDLAFIQSIDKPRCLGPLLKEFSGYFRKHGIDVAALGNGDAVDRKLLGVFTQPTEEMPANLLEALYVLDDLADEAGHDRILAEAQRLDVDLNGIGDTLNPGEFAIALYMKEPMLVHHCHEKTIYRKVKKYQEFQAAEDMRLSLSAARRKRAGLERELGPWYKKMDRSGVCEVYVYEEDGEIKFQLTHGKTYITNSTIDRKDRRSRVAFRPQRHDSVIYNNRTCMLKVNTETAAELEKYRRTFGEVLFGDAEHFPPGDIYTLDALKQPGFELKITDGIQSARLVEVCVEILDADGFVQTSKCKDLLARAKNSGSPNLADGSIVRAAFLIKYSSGGRARRLDVRPPDTAIYDHDRDGVPAEGFMDKNGFRKLEADRGDE